MRPLVLMSLESQWGAKLRQPKRGSSGGAGGDGGTFAFCEETLSVLCGLADSILLPGGSDIDPANFREEPLSSQWS